MAKLKPNLPRGYFSLPKHEQQAIKDAVAQWTELSVDKEICDTQIIWIHIACTVINKVMKSVELATTTPCDFICSFLAVFKRMYVYNSRLPNKEAQDAWLKAEMAEIFGEDGFPEDYVQDFRNIGR